MSIEFNPILDGGRSEFSVQQFGRNPDIGSGAIEDVWELGGTYPFPIAAQTTTIQSSSAADAVGGTGAEAVTIQGLDGNFNTVEETVSLNGATAVTLTNQYIRHNFSFIRQTGSNGTNVGTITIQHGATVIGQINPGVGQTLQAIYTTPNDWPSLLGLRWYGALGRAQATSGTIELRGRLFQEGFRTISVFDLNSQGTATFTLPFPVTPEIQPKTDIFIRAEVTANGTGVSGGFDLSA